jgi:hypothetical protein
MLFDRIHLLERLIGNDGFNGVTVNPTEALNGIALSQTLAHYDNPWIHEQQLGRPGIEITAGLGREKNMDGFAVSGVFALIFWNLSREGKSAS